MTLQGFSVPLSPQGRASAAPAPPWFYVGNLLLFDFWADPEAVAAVLPPRIEPDAEDPGRCSAYFVDWQYASAGGQEPLDPVRSQYHELILLVNGRFRGAPVSTCPYIYVDMDASLVRGWIQGWPKKLGTVHTTRTFGLPTPAAPLVEPGARFAGTLSVGGRRIAEGSVTLEGVSEDPQYLGRRPIVNVRHFPQLASAQQRRPAVHELVRSILGDVQRSEVWEGSCQLAFFDAPDQELSALNPVRVGRGYRYTTAFRVDDLEVLESLVPQPTTVAG
jgi:acetoacetate decarboxylase